MGVHSNRNTNKIAITRNNNNESGILGSPKIERFVSSTLMKMEPQVLIDPLSDDPKDMKWVVMEKDNEYQLRPKWSHRDNETPLLPFHFGRIGEPVFTMEKKGDITSAVLNLVEQLPEDEQNRKELWFLAMENPYHNPLSNQPEIYQSWNKPVPFRNSKEFQKWLNKQPGLENLKCYFPRFNSRELKALGDAFYDFNEMFPGLIAGLKTLSLRDESPLIRMLSDSCGFYDSGVGYMSISSKKIRDCVNNPEKVKQENQSKIEGLTYTSGASVKSVVWHELSHVMHHALMVSPEFQEIRDMDIRLKLDGKEQEPIPLLGNDGFFGHEEPPEDIWRGVSGYAKTSGIELFAESVSALIDRDSGYAQRQNLALQSLSKVLPRISRILYSKRN